RLHQPTRLPSPRTRARKRSRPGWQDSSTPKAHRRAPTGDIDQLASEHAIAKGRLVRPSFYHRLASHCEIGSGLVRGVVKELAVKSEWGHLPGKLCRARAGLGAWCVT